MILIPGMLKENLKLLPAIEAGAQIEWFDPTSNQWVSTGSFNCLETLKYRLKLQPAVVYGVKFASGEVSCIVESRLETVFADRYKPEGSVVIKLQEVEMTKEEKEILNGRD